MTTTRTQPAGDLALSPMDRLAAFYDPGSMQVIRSGIISRGLGDRARRGDGVIGAAGRVGGRPVFAYAQDASHVGGSVSARHAETITQMMDLAGEASAPLVGFVESGGARMQEGVAALAGYGEIFRRNVGLSGRIPQISVITGASAGGGCYSPALTDFVVMTEEAQMFLTGPQVVHDAVGELVSAAELGGRRVHERNGLCQFVTPTDRHAVQLVRQLLSYLPQCAGAQPAMRRSERPARSDPSEHVPSRARERYDVRTVIEGIVDAGSILEVSPKWARNMLTALCRIEGRTVGVIANQPNFLGGLLDVPASEKGARFVHTCNSYGIPMLVLVDTPGFIPGRRQEVRGIIRHGSTLVREFASANVPRLTLVLRKAFGGAYIAMNSKAIGAQFYFAWPDAEMGIMGASQAVGIAHRRELSTAVDPDMARAELARRYSEEHLRSERAAEDGFIDEVVTPADTRVRIASAFEVLSGRRALHLLKEVDN